MHITNTVPTKKKTYAHKTDRNKFSVKAYVLDKDHFLAALIDFSIYNNQKIAPICQSHNSYFISPFLSIPIWMLLVGNCFNWSYYYVSQPTPKYS